MDYIIKSLLDTDYYKLTMGQWIFHRYPNIPVTSAFLNRTKSVCVPDFIDEGALRRELDHVLELTLTNDESEYLRGIRHNGTRIFGDDFVDFFKTLELTEYILERSGDIYRLEFPGPWARQTHWEIYALPIITELYFRSLLEKKDKIERLVIRGIGKYRLNEKIRILAEHPYVRFIDFATRRRYSREHHDDAVRTAKERLSARQFIGTSNVFLAKKYGLSPMGTMAHELFMVMAGIMGDSDENVRLSHGRVTDEWWNEYGEALSIYLPDTYGSDFGLSDFSPEHAKRWRGVRQDSGIPIFFGKSQLIPFYKRLGIDPREKLMVPSDSLDEYRMIEISDKFKDEIGIIHGLGTKFANDFGLKTPSFIIKPVEACGRGLVKLSDTISKATGRPEDIERFKRIFGYSSVFSEECRS